MLDDKAQASVAALETRGLTKQFGRGPKARVSVDHLDLTIQQGEVYALLGDNGAGKTTTIGMLTTLLPPTAGYFKICGFDGRKQSEKTKGLFGVVSQDVAVYQELTVWENLKFLADLYGIEEKKAQTRIEKLLARYDLADRINEPAERLSGGMQRRLAIACAMVNSPRVLFMDEPTVGLDPGARRQIWATIKELKTLGVTILLTTHYLEEAELLADRIGIIKGGKLLIEGTVAQLTQKIRGMRGISVKFDPRFFVEPEQRTKLDEALQRLRQAFPDALAAPEAVRIDELRNTIYFLSVHEALAGEAEKFFKAIYQWLEDEKLDFVRVAFGEPNLEDVFMAVIK